MEFVPFDLHSTQFLVDKVHILRTEQENLKQPTPIGRYLYAPYAIFFNLGQNPFKVDSTTV